MSPPPTPVGPVRLMLLAAAAEGLLGTLLTRRSRHLNGASLHGRCNISEGSQTASAIGRGMILRARQICLAPGLRCGHHRHATVAPGGTSEILLTGNPELIEQYRHLHATSVYGDTSLKSLRFVRAEIVLLHPRSILDYGCGQSQLIDSLRLGYPAELMRYDPAIPRWAKKPDKVVDLLICIDVLEHIEEADLDAVLADMAGLCHNALIIIDTKPAVAILPDGRNAHVTVRPHAWWRRRLSKHFAAVHGTATTRRSRAGFKTWPRPAKHMPRYLAIRVADTARHYAGRFVAKAGIH